MLERTAESKGYSTAMSMLDPVIGHANRAEPLKGPEHQVRREAGRSRWYKAIAIKEWRSH